MGGFLDGRANLAGKVAAVVGGGGGIGAGISRALAGAGVDVAICDIDAGALAETETAIRAMGRTVTAMTADATDEAALDAFYDAVERDFPRLDILVNVAGGTKRQRLAEASRADIARDIHRNYGYVVQSVQRAVPLIKRSGQGGSIISFTTIEAHRGAASFSVYAGAKAATTNFTRSMAVELGKDRIRVSCIAPDTTLSHGNMAAMPPSFAEDFARLRPEAMGKGMDMYIPRGEQPPVDALADAVLFLGSDLSTFVSGMTLHVDGGTMAAAGFLDWPFGDGFVPTPLAGTLGRLYREGDLDVILYAVMLSPFAARVRLALRVKGLDYDLQPPPGGSTRSPDYLAINPIGKLPVLVTDAGLAIAESETIIDYLDEQFPVPPLMPDDAAERARMRNIIRCLELYAIPAMARLFGQMDPATRDATVVAAEVERWRAGLALVNQFTADAPFAVGHAISKADCILLPSLLLCEVTAGIFALEDPIAEWAALAGYRDKARQHPDMAAIWTETEQALAAMRAGT